MFKVNKNDKGFQELNAYATKVNRPLKEVLLSDEHLEEVSIIFYRHLPRMVRMAMNQKRFTDYYKNNREKLVNSILI